MIKTLSLLLVVALVAGACRDEETPAGSTDDRSPVFVDSVEFLYLESYPVQVRAIVRGNLPTPCHELHWDFDTTAAVAPTIVLYSTVDPDVVCAQVLEPFEETIDLGSFETGQYVLQIGESTYPFEI